MKSPPALMHGIVITGIRKTRQNASMTIKNAVQCEDINTAKIQPTDGMTVKNRNAGTNLIASRKYADSI